MKFYSIMYSGVYSTVAVRYCRQKDGWYVYYCVLLVHVVISCAGSVIKIDFTDGSLFASGLIIECNTKNSARHLVGGTKFNLIKFKWDPNLIKILRFTRVHQLHFAASLSKPLIFPAYSPLLPCTVQACSKQLNGWHQKIADKKYTLVEEEVICL